MAPEDRLEIYARQRAEREKEEFRESRREAAVALTGCAGVLALLGGSVYLGYSRATDGSIKGDLGELLGVPLGATAAGAVVAGLTPNRGGDIDGYPLWPAWAGGTGTLAVAGELFGVFLAYATR